MRGDGKTAISGNWAFIGRMLMEWLEMIMNIGDGMK